MDLRKRQKKIERQKAKKKAERRALAQREAGGRPARLREAIGGPVIHCCVHAGIEQAGLGQLLISRRLANGDVAFAAFLLDIYCLGVKNVMFDVRPAAEYEERVYAKIQRDSRLRSLTLACARKWIESAVAYAEYCGLSPHPDYRTARLIFADADAASCPQEFNFGKDGKPLFIAGPYDDATRCNYILRTLEERFGPDGFDFVLPTDMLTQEIDEEE